MKKNILIAPLNWGIGHASRCVPIIMECLRNGHKVILASDGAAKKYLEAEFPDLKVEELPGYGITYPKNGNFVWHMAQKLPQIVGAIIGERKGTKELVNKYDIDVVISDNRYGVYSKKVKSIIITHQTRVPLGIGGVLLNHQIHKYLSKFNQVWVPDVDGDFNASGKLSHKNVKGIDPIYLGILSRMNECVLAKKPNRFPFEKDFVLGLVSGPEPQRSEFEKKIIKESLTIPNQTVVVGGDFRHENSVTTGKLHCIPFANTEEIKWLVEHCETVISRSGYSTIMDLIALKQTAIFVPTPGQVEQEYLANQLEELNIFVVQSQEDFNLREALTNISKKEWNPKVNEWRTPQKLTEIINGI